MKRVILVGAGQIGSRHLQALKNVKTPLLITVVDTSADSLKIARDRFEEISPSTHIHRISFVQEIPRTGTTVDLAIIATTSAHRRDAIEQLIEKNHCTHFLLEKLLFQKPEDYEVVNNLFKRTETKAWVNCTMRTIPFYAEMKKIGGLKKINYSVGSGETGLVTSIVHFLDHIAYLTNCLNFTVDTSLLERKTIESKRKGFIELLGTVRATFEDGSFASFTRYPRGTEPSLITVTNDEIAYIIKETEEKSYISERSNNWKWIEVRSPVPLLSTMSTWLVEEILSTGKCRAVTYEDSAKIHLQILEPLRQFLNRNGGNYDHFPFT